MKKSVKVIISLVLCLAVLFAFAACNGKPEAEETKAPSVSDGGRESFKVGIIQYSSNPSLDNCSNGIEKALKESGLQIEIDRQIGSDSAPDSDCKTYAESMVAKKYDLIFAVATPAATVAYAATEGTDIPVIFCAVSDPVSAKLVDSMEEPAVFAQAHLISLILTRRLT